MFSERRSEWIHKQIFKNKNEFLHLYLWGESQALQTSSVTLKEMFSMAPVPSSAKEKLV